jgi:hypothetical protein
MMISNPDCPFLMQVSRLSLYGWSKKMIHGALLKKDTYMYYFYSYLHKCRNNPRFSANFIKNVGMVLAIY